MDLKILKIDNSCTGCGACANICSKQCLRLEPDDEGFFYPKYDDANCIECGLCEKACHVVTPHEHPSPSRDRFFLYHSNEASLLQASSSGGAFTLFANWVLSQGGVVFGSRYNGDRECLEVFSTDETSLASLRKSKYLESYTGSAFSEIRKQLQSRRRVLYCGTPCQVRGLKQYLATTHTKTDLLLTMDFACHGVPSNDYFRQFKHMFERKGKKVVDVDFRHKDFSKPNMMWHNMTLRLGFSDGSEKVFPRYYYYYYYYEPFLNNLFLRKSCYQCDIALHSDADVSLGDFWGINKHRKELDDNKGMSFISINSERYLSLWVELSKEGFSEPLPFEAVAYQYEDKREKHAKQLKARNDFVKSIKEKDYKRAVTDHYGKMKMFSTFYIRRVKNFIKSLLGKTIS